MHIGPNGMPTRLRPRVPGGFVQRGTNLRGNCCSRIPIRNRHPSKHRWLASRPVFDPTIDQQRDGSSLPDNRPAGEFGTRDLPTRHVARLGRSSCRESGSQRLPTGRGRRAPDPREGGRNPSQRICLTVTQGDLGLVRGTCSGEGCHLTDAAGFSWELEGTPPRSFLPHRLVCLGSSGAGTTCVLAEVAGQVLGS